MTVYTQEKVDRLHAGKGATLDTSENEIVKGFTDAIDKDAIDKLTIKELDRVLEILKNIK